MKATPLLCYFLVALTLVSTTVGLFYSTGEERFSVSNIYGETIELYGDGIYRYNSVLKAGGNKGTDLVMLFVALTLAFLTARRSEDRRSRYIRGGLLAGLLYYSACLVFGVTFNGLFLVYVLQFSTSLFALIFLIIDLLREGHLARVLAGKRLRGTAIFLLVSGGSVLVWLEFIIPALLSRQPLSTIEVYTTEPTFVLDLAIVLPVYVGCAISLLRQRVLGYELAPVLLTFITIIGVTVIGQNVFQSALGVFIPFRQLLGLVVSFVVLGAIATFLNTRLLRYVK
ncbi:MAG: hypothetical protein GX249_02705 [Firmicutes bacterium]|nr:hypothetical protein [Bacillota bacterium]